MIKTCRRIFDTLTHCWNHNLKTQLELWHKDIISYLRGTSHFYLVSLNMEWCSGVQCSGSMRVFVYVIIILISSRPWPAQSGQVETTELRQCNYNMLVCAGTRAGLLHCCTSTETVHTTLDTGHWTLDTDWTLDTGHWLDTDWTLETPGDTNLNLLSAFGSITLVVGVVM